MLWVLMLALPFPYIANTAGWMTAELGRQPWLIYGLMRTAQGSRRTSRRAMGCSPCWDSWACTWSWVILFLFLVGREIEHGPGEPRQEAG